MKKLLTVAALTVSAAVAGLTGCGGSYVCCNQTSYYDCASVEAADACQDRNDFTNCTRNSGKDNSCLAR